MTSLPLAVAQLIERFAYQRDAYRNPAYNETQTRREFIDPFFAALGWDVDNQAGLAEAYKDVIHEDAIKVGGATKAPDYCFRIGGTRKFFVEAKKPAVGIESDPEPAYQLRRYAWTSKLPLSILTDFEELAVYDCRIPPKPGDKAAVARVFYCTFDQYPAKWAEIAGLFSKDAVLKGAFDKYAESNKRKRGTAEVDTEFLRQIEAWREALAQNFALRNPGLAARDLNFAVQRTIDRLVFLRMCEDRGIELYGNLNALCNGDHVYERLAVIFRQADDRYNSGLFYFTPESHREPADTLTLALKLDDKVLKDIIKSLYYPESPYEFSVLPPEILGQVYEQFLGKVIRLTAGHHAKVEEKPEVRKAGGVYYTPSYIVDYIVQNTVGKLLEGRTPAQVGPDLPAPRSARGARQSTPAAKPRRGPAPLRILDPACGSGSFLLGAYQYLLNWHRDWYVNDGPARHKDRLYQGAGGRWLLTIQEKKRILLNNIYGVDIDAQAVETTKLSLLLKVLEGETEHTLGSALRLFHERALPDLDRNIKCGNSLIGPDFYNGQQMTMFDEEERLRINAFDWRAEFAEVFAGENPGFDAVIGNPPYGAVFGQEELGYLAAHYSCFAARADSYVAFLQGGLGLARYSGLLGMIVPSALFGGPAYIAVRTRLLSQCEWRNAVLLPYDVFSGAYIDTCIMCICRVEKPAPENAVNTFEYPKRHRIVTMSNIEHVRVIQATWHSDAEHRIIVDPHVSGLLSSISARTRTTFADVAEMKRGVLPGPNSLSPARTTKHAHPYFDGSVYRYVVQNGTGQYIAFDDELRERPRELKWFLGQRILLRRLVNRQFRLMAAMMGTDVITNKNLYSILARTGTSLAPILAVLNSRLMSYFYIKRVTQAAKDDFGQVTIKDIMALPWVTPTAAQTAAFTRLVAEMNGLPKQLAAAKTAHAQTAIQRQVDTTDCQIDQLVYELYGLTDAEIRIVEEATAASGGRET